MVVNSAERTMTLLVDRRPVRGSPMSYRGNRERTSTGSVKFDTYYSRFRLGVGNPRLSLESDFFSGVLDELRAFGRALSLAEIDALP